MKYRTVYVNALWHDAKFRNLSRNGRELFLYLLTSPSTDALPGIFYSPDVIIARQIQRSVKWVRRSFDELASVGMAYYDRKSDIVCLPNALKHNPPSNPNIACAWAKAWLELPEFERKRDRTDAILTQICSKGGQTAAKFFTVIAQSETDYDAFCQSASRQNVDISRFCNRAKRNGSETVPEPLPNGSETVSKPRTRTTTVSKNLELVMKGDGPVVDNAVDNSAAASRTEPPSTESRATPRTVTVDMSEGAGQIGFRLPPTTGRLERSLPLVELSSPKAGHSVAVEKPSEDAPPLFEKDFVGVGDVLRGMGEPNAMSTSRRATVHDVTVDRLADVAKAEWYWPYPTAEQRHKAAALAPFTAAELRRAKAVVDAKATGPRIGYMSFLLTVVERSRTGQPQTQVPKREAAERDVATRIGVIEQRKRAIRDQLMTLKPDDPAYAELAERHTALTAERNRLAASLDA